MVTEEWAPALTAVGMITDACWTDADKDGDPDLVITGEWMGILCFENKQGKLEPHKTGTQTATGWWNSLTACDLDHDGDVDWIAGNQGENGYYRPYPDQPINLYSNDFDANGKLDILISQWRATAPHQVNRQEYPGALREQVVEAIPMLKKQYNNYSLYAKASMKEVLQPLPDKDRLQLSASTFQSVWIENKGSFEWTIHPLPAAAQLAPVYGIVTGDFNGDGKEDIVLNGNEYAMEPMVGRYDALNGLLLQGNGKGAFTAQPAGQSGIVLPGDGKALAQIWLGDTLAILASQNGGPLQIFIQQQPTTKKLVFANGETHALVTFKDGSTQLLEPRWGSSSLSQSSLNFGWTPAMQQVQLYKGKQVSNTIR